MNKHRAVGVKDLESGKVTICASADAGGAGYGTLCGTSLDDDMFCEVPIAVNVRIECVQCKQIWKTARSFKAENFKDRS